MPALIAGTELYGCVFYEVILVDCNLLVKISFDVYMLINYNHLVVLHDCSQPFALLIV